MLPNVSWLWSCRSRLPFLGSTSLLLMTAWKQPSTHQPSSRPGTQGSLSLVPPASTPLGFLWTVIGWGSGAGQILLGVERVGRLPDGSATPLPFRTGNALRLSILGHVMTYLRPPLSLTTLSPPLTSWTHPLRGKISLYFESDYELCSLYWGGGVSSWYLLFIYELLR